ncbi:UDP-2-acetamido-2,6-beta-L-arabino-hexul-4-ose reductase [Pseudomonas lactis]|uniref:UDP-2-acetamido-2,6-dideoxy-L-lyxo-4-hexulose 4-reductase WbjC n=1 Tax=Pseudomonas lactis TaxID=1615674 RepID=I4K9T9_9PSED|nr:NAD-dependent epimerase/dehydratase family protein [Pseudomonas lactis]EIK61479.1 UDP-2-acetamido-2,6-dideoxy-L-lyxo-4-hexulose 4-reductase WbjC [Pseudomonas lactis]
MKVLITGAGGFIGKNLISHLGERNDVEMRQFNRGDDVSQLNRLVEGVDFIFHLAGVNRPKSPEEFKSGNAELTSVLCHAIEASGKPIPVLYTSSSQAELNNEYGESKRAAENSLLELSRRTGSKVYLFRLPNVFGKWARPNYNSAVATFCHNITLGLPIQINDPDAIINLVYVDDVVECFVSAMNGRLSTEVFVDVAPLYSISVGDLANQLQAFKDSRENLISEPVGVGLVRALYSTYVSYLRPDNFAYQVPRHADPRGVFVEMLKTVDSGQFSYFTAFPGVTRGGHYHHSKTEKFLVIKGNALFRFRDIVSGEFYELRTNGEKPEIVETVPGWTHDITNVGENEMIVMLWANEIFDREKPDTYARPVGTTA